MVFKHTARLSVSINCGVIEKKKFLFLFGAKITQDRLEIPNKKEDLQVLETNALPTELHP